jgi:hypothetical protein
VIPQLLLAKRLFLEASTYIDRGEPVAAGMAISLLQDSAELCLWTIIKERSIPVKDQSGFISNIESVQKAGAVVPNASKLLELNKARVGFKHYGNLPAASEATKHQTYVEDFLRDTMKTFFNVAFDDLSLVDLVSDQGTKEQLREAEENIRAGAFNEAADALAKAKYLTFNRMQKYLPKVDGRLRDTDKMLNAIEGVRGVNSFAYMAEYLGALREGTLVAMLGLSVEDYAFLRNSLPNVCRAIAGNWSMSRSRSSYTESECRKALSAIVNLCQKLESRS